MFEFGIGKVVELDGKVIHVLKLVKASKYLIFHITKNIIMGAFIDENDDVIGINTYSKDNIYQPSKLVNKYDSDRFTYVPPDCEKYLDWWNRLCEQGEPKPYDDIVVPFEKMKEYFTETIETDNNTTWYTYYINPPVGVAVRLGHNSEVSFTGQRIEKIMIIKSKDMEYENMICCYDKHDSFVEDIDVATHLPLSEISFIFEYADLQSASTTNKEQQSYTSLWEKLSPYNSVDENRKLLEDWLEQHNELRKERNIE